MKAQCPTANPHLKGGGKGAWGKGQWGKEGQWGKAGGKGKGGKGKGGKGKGGKGYGGKGKGVYGLDLMGGYGGEEQWGGEQWGEEQWGEQWATPGMRSLAEGAGPWKKALSALGPKERAAKAAAEAGAKGVAIANRFAPFDDLPLSAFVRTRKKAIGKHKK